MGSNAILSSLGMLDSYTHLLEMVAERGDKKAADEAVSKLIMHLKSSGRVKMLTEIATELRKVAARRAALAPKVEVASQKESAAALKEAAKFGIEAKHAVVNHSLIHGWRAQKAGVLVDRSAKRALVDIYKTVIQ